MLKRQFGYRRLDRVHEEERREQQRAKWRRGGVRNGFRQPDQGLQKQAQPTTMSPSPSAANANGKGGGRMLVTLHVVVHVFFNPPPTENA